MNTAKNLTATSIFQNMLKASLVALLLIALNSCSGDDDSSNNTTTPPPTGSNGVTAPDFSLTSLDNTTVKLSDSPNKVVVIFFFGNECPSCKAAAPKINSDLYAPYASNANFKFYGIDQWDGNAAKVQSFKTITGVGFPLLLMGSSVAASYKTTYDRLVVIDKAGKIAFSGTQGASSDVNAAKAKIDELLK
ncbi:peroxiredoxin [Lutibacter sp.]|uniref:peroxiredoxin family protein n=1 Tax=Lutibacter sp. TaxID=1925666 RepID=UPI0027367B8B|nr:TlpA disulfide reductase family protein [Lutibacter sp.]MDP3311921.1 TlpA disulfide reductase family protein [Lutibacter sp.]